MSRRLLVATLLACAVAWPLHADFNDIARAIDRQDGVKRVWIPFLGIARLAVRIVEPEGVHDFQLVTFTGAEKTDSRHLQQIMRTHIGPGFKPLVQVWSKKSNERSFIYARPRGELIELVVLAQDDGETVLVRVEVDANVVARQIELQPRNVTSVARR